METGSFCYNGRVLATAALPAGWQCAAAPLPEYQSSAYPTTLHLEAGSPDGAIRFFAESARAYTHALKDIGLQHQDGMLVPDSGARLLQFQTTAQYLDGLAASMAGGYRLQLVQETPSLPLFSQPDPAQMQQLCPPVTRARMELVCAGTPAPVVDARYYQPLTRIYRVEGGARPVFLLLAGSVTAFRWYANMPDMPLTAGFGMLQSLWNRPAAPSTAPAGAGAEYTLRTPVPGKISSATEWTVPAVYGMLAPEMDAALQSDFTAFCSSIRYAQDFLQEQAQRSQNAVAQMQLSLQRQQTQANIFSMNAQRDISRRQMQIGQSIQARSEMSMDSWNLRQAAQSRMSQNFSEAVRGVNTYVRPDGTTTEVSVSAERVFMKNNDPNTLYSARPGEQVPYGWTELQRKEP